MRATPKQTTSGSTPTPKPVQFGEVVRLRRVQLGMTQAELAKALRVSQPHVCDVEAGKRGMSARVMRRYEKVMKGQAL